MAGLLEDYTPLAGDRTFGDDRAIQGGLARFRGRSMMVLGHEKGTDTEGRVRHNFGMANPEGYRKAVRLMHMAERFRLPVITLVDTPGAYPGVGAEERGQAEAIARTIEACLQLAVPVVGVIIGEGGSGGAVALAVADRVLMLEYAVYSVISPEGCAAILWRSGEQAPAAAEAMRLTAQDLRQLGVVDEIIPEPVGGAHRAACRGHRGRGRRARGGARAPGRRRRRRAAAQAAREVPGHGPQRRAVAVPLSLRDRHAQVVVPARIRADRRRQHRAPAASAARSASPDRGRCVIRNSPGRSVGATPQPSATMVEVR